VSTALVHLSRPQATVLALWSHGLVFSRTSGIPLVWAALALQRGCSEARLVQRLREWCHESSAKRRANRRKLEVSTCFAPLLRWVLIPTGVSPMQ
jgi:hypothetical protein